MKQPVNQNLAALSTFLLSGIYLISKHFSVDQVNQVSGPRKANKSKGHSREIRSPKIRQSSGRKIQKMNSKNTRRKGLERRNTRRDDELAKKDGNRFKYAREGSLIGDK